MDLHHLLEPEETIGNLWHRLVGGRHDVAHHTDAAVAFGEVEAALRVFFHGLGGEAGVELKAALAEPSQHRRGLLQRIGAGSERIARASFDGDRLALPDVLDVLAERDLNRRLYYWLAAWSAVAAEESEPRPMRDPRAHDIARLAHAASTTARVLDRYPGLAAPYERLRAAVLDARPRRVLPAAEAEVETAIRALLGDATIASPLADAISAGGEWPETGEAPIGYRPYLPVPLWGERLARPERSKAARRDEEAASSGKPSGGGDSRQRRAKRRKSDEIERKNPFFLHRFEKILSWSEFMNLHRDVEDDEEQQAQKAADDHDEIGVANLQKRPKTLLKMDLDLAPADVDAERLSDAFVYPEWDYRRKAEIADHARVLERKGEEAEEGSGWQPGPRSERRIRQVRRQFEALRPKREILPRQLDGSELDMDALIRTRADLRATGEGSDRIYRQAREEARDLSVAVLVDASRSTESYVANRPVIDLEREALIALAEGIAACGDDVGVLAFHSLRRDRVFVTELKGFDEPASATVRRRIANLKPGFYTRLGAAVRHASMRLAERPTRRRLLLVLTDGKPNDLDHYEGRYGIEDTRRAILDARANGLVVFGVTIDDKAKDYFPRIFGAGAFAILSRPSRLTAALPLIYRHLVR
ncbi:MAG: VWA domain-containing protein [Pseudomonadota bacterium]